MRTFPGLAHRMERLGEGSERSFRYRVDLDRDSVWDWEFDEPDTEQAYAAIVKRRGY